MASLDTPQKKSLEEKLDILDSIASKMNQKFGKKVMGRIGADPEIMQRLNIDFIPTPCRDLNDAVGGGLPKRRCTIITGMPDSGKTSLVLETIAKNMWNPDGTPTDFVACWLESENSLKKEYVCDTFHIDPARFFFIVHDPKTGAEQVLDVVQGILEAGAVDLFCINSLTALTPVKEMDASLKDETVAIAARRNSKLARKFRPIVAEYDTAFILICHLSTSIGSMSRDPMIISGGHAIVFWSSLTLDARRKTIGPDDLIKKEDGVKIAITVKKNHCIPERRNPYCRIEYYAIFGEGIEQYMSSIGKAISSGILVKHGAWLYWVDPANPDGEPLQKFQGSAAYRSFMKENPVEWAKFQDMLDGTYEPEVQPLSDAEVVAIMQEEQELGEMGAKSKNKKQKAG